MRGVWKVSAVLTALVLVVSGVAMFGYSGTNEEGKGLISLVAPPFIGAAGASPAGGGGGAAPRAGTTFLEEEAGISAYTNVGETIDLKKAKTAFRTIEYETDEYIIGSVPLPDYPETEDVHAYVHKDGWIVVYYLKEEPASKILDWEDYDTDEKITGTKLEDGINAVCAAAQVPSKDIKYYDFRYPNANRLMIVADAQWSEGTDTFNIKIPSDFKVYERSYSHYAYDSYGSNMKIDGDVISTIGRCDDYSVTNYGELTWDQLSPDVFHNVSLWHDEYVGYGRYQGEAFCAIVLIYQET